MLPYWLLFLLIAYFALTRVRVLPQGVAARHWPGYWWVIFVVLVLMIGLRHEVGGDWSAYVEHVASAAELPMVAAFMQVDPGYFFFNWLGSRWGGIYLVDSVCALIFSWGLITFCRTQPMPWLALLVAVPYLVIVVAMGYSRQSAAIGLVMVAMVALSKGKSKQFLGWITVAALFHQTAIIFIPFVIFSTHKHKIKIAIYGGIVALLLFIFLSQRFLQYFYDSYLDAQYESAGAGVRIAMNALPALILLLFGKRLLISNQQVDFWNWMAAIALLFVLALYLSPSSTAVDRLALYWIPLQLFVWARFPLLLGSTRGAKLLGIWLVVLYSAAVLFVFLFFADLRYSWVPYGSLLYWD